MKLTVATMARNEEKIVPYFIHHYSDIVDEIIFIDNESTDNTEKIVKDMCSKFGVNLIYYPLKTGGFNESLKLQVYTSVQKNVFNTNSDWYILVDCDELIYDKSNQLKNKLIKYYDDGFLFIKPKGYQMSELEFPEYKGSKITDTCVMGCEDSGFDKPVIVHKELTWIPSLGCHLADGLVDRKPVSPKTDQDILLLHYKLLGNQYRIDRIRHFANNLDEYGKQMLDNGINTQLKATDQVLLDDFNRNYNKRHKVI